MQKAEEWKSGSNCRVHRLPLSIPTTVQQSLSSLLTHFKWSESITNTTVSSKLGGRSHSLPT